MQAEVDTGSRLDQSGDTTFGFSDDIQRAILLRQTTRNECLWKLTGRKLSKELRLFSACVYLLIKDYLDYLDEIKIDNEYPGHEGDIKRYLANIIRTYYPHTRFNEEYIKVASIGKNRPAHEVAWKTLRKKREVDKVLNTQEILNLLLK